MFAKSCRNGCVVYLTNKLPLKNSNNNSLNFIKIYSTHRCTVYINIYNSSNNKIVILRH